MGGRGASSGMSNQGNPYGSQYHTLYQDGDVKFITKNSRGSESLMETMTDGRIYATVNGGEVKAVTLFDEKNKRKTLLEKDQRTGQWHAHHGYFHSELDVDDKHPQLNKSEQKILDDILKKWDNRK